MNHTSNTPTAKVLDFGTGLTINVLDAKAKVAKINQEIAEGKREIPGNVPLESPEARATELLSRVRTGPWLARQEFNPLQWAIQDVVPEGVGLIIGPPKLGKSWVTLDMAMAVATGTVCLGDLQAGRARPVLLLALEDGDRRLQERAEALGKDLGASRLSYVTECPPADVLDTIVAWLNSFGMMQPLVIVDTLAKVMAPAKRGETNYERDYRHMSEFKAMAQRWPGATILAVHHTRKAASEDWMDGTSGTQGLNGGVDFTLRLDGKRGHDQSILLGTGRDMPDVEIALKRAATGSWVMEGESLDEAKMIAKQRHTTEQLSSIMSDVLNAVDRPVTSGEVAAVVGKSSAYVNVYLQRLLKQGLIRRSARGTYAPLEADTQ